MKDETWQMSYQHGISNFAPPPQINLACILNCLKNTQRPGGCLQISRTFCRTSEKWQVGCSGSQESCRVEFAQGPQTGKSIRSVNACWQTFFYSFRLLLCSFACFLNIKFFVPLLVQVEKVRDEMRTAGVKPSEEFLHSPDTTGNCALDINSVQRVAEVWPVIKLLMFLRTHHFSDKCHEKERKNEKKNKHLSLLFHRVFLPIYRAHLTRLEIQLIFDEDENVCKHLRE